jgi:hypothetical protein
VSSFFLQRNFKRKGPFTPRAITETTTFSELINDKYIDNKNPPDFEKLVHLKRQRTGAY